MLWSGLKVAVLLGLAAASLGLACVAFGFVGDDDPPEDDPAGAGGASVSREAIVARLDESLRRRDAALAAFRAMTPAEHLAAARAELARPSGPRGCLPWDCHGWEEAARHARAVPAGVTEGAEAAALLATLDARAEAAVRGEEHVTVFAGRRRAHRDGGVTPPGHARRRFGWRLRRELDRRGVYLWEVRPGSDAEPDLALTSSACSQRLIDALVARDDARAALRAAGFRRVRCAAWGLGEWTREP